MMMMNLDYQFDYNGKTYNGVGVEIGETMDLDEEAKDIKGLKLSAICHAFDLMIDEGEEIEKILDKAHFAWCDLRV